MVWCIWLLGSISSQCTGAYSLVERNMIQYQKSRTKWLAFACHNFSLYTAYTCKHKSIFPYMVWENNLNVGLLTINKACYCGKLLLRIFFWIGWATKAVMIKIRVLWNPVNATLYKISIGMVRCRFHEHQVASKLEWECLANYHIATCHSSAWEVFH